MGLLNDLDQIFTAALGATSQKQKSDAQAAWQSEMDRFSDVVKKISHRVTEEILQLEKEKGAVSKACDPSDAIANETLAECQMLKPEVYLVFQCPTCYGEIDEGDRFCRHCGQPIDWTDWDDEDDEDPEDELMDDEENE